MPGNDFELRAASNHDLDATYDLFAEVQSIHADAEPEFFRRPENDETFRQFFGRTVNDPEQHIVFACFDGITVGYILFFMGSRPRNIYQPERPFAYIHQLVVTKEFRRTGCATTWSTAPMLPARRMFSSAMKSFSAVGATRGCATPSPIETGWASWSESSEPRRSIRSWRAAGNCCCRIARPTASPTVAGLPVANKNSKNDESNKSDKNN